MSQETSLRVKLVNPQRVILEEIAMPKMTRNGVALTYAFCLRQRDHDQAWINFGMINRAIVGRWSFSALDYIKARAWGIYEGRIAP
jgi:hypothetical protein